MLKFEYFIELKEGYKPVMQTEEETIKILIEAENRATADRAIKALLKDASNVKEYDGVCLFNTTDENLEIFAELNKQDIWDLCVGYEYYTLGDNEQHSRMINEYGNRKLDVVEIEDMAVNIKNHSITKDNVFTIMNHIAVYASCVIDKPEIDKIV